MSVVLHSPWMGMKTDSPEQHQSCAEAIPWLCAWFQFYLIKKLLELNQAAVKPHSQLHFITFQNRFWLQAWFGAWVKQLRQLSKATALSTSLPALTFPQRLSGQGFCHLRKVNLASGYCPFVSRHQFAHLWSAGAAAPSGSASRQPPCFAHTAEPLVCRQPSRSSPRCLAARMSFPAIQEERNGAVKFYWCPGTHGTQPWEHRRGRGLQHPSWYLRQGIVVSTHGWVKKLS